MSLTDVLAKFQASVGHGRQLEGLLKTILFSKQALFGISCNNMFFSRIESNSNGVIVSGFSTHSDLSISICIAKVRLKSYLFTYQMSGDPITRS